MNENPFKKFLSKSKPYVAAGLATVGSILPIESHSQNTDNKTKAPTEQVHENNKGVFSKEYKSNDMFYRTTAKGSSRDISAAKEIALFNAKTTIAHEQNSTPGTHETHLSGVSISEEHLFQNPDGSYTYWVAVEVAK